MSTIANALKSEIARVSRKEIKAEVLALRKASSAHRAEIAALKRALKTLASLVRQLQKSSAGAGATVQARPPVAASAGSSERRAVAGKRRPDFSGELLLAHRTKLGLTQVQMARLIGASALSVYKWESGKARPRAAQQEQIAAALKLGKRAAWAKLNDSQA